MKNVPNFVISNALVGDFSPSGTTRISSCPLRIRDWQLEDIFVRTVHIFYELSLFNSGALTFVELNSPLCAPQ